MDGTLPTPTISPAPAAAWNILAADHQGGNKAAIMLAGGEPTATAITAVTPMAPTVARIDADPRNPAAIVVSRRIIGRNATGHAILTMAPGFCPVAQ